MTLFLAYLCGHFSIFIFEAIYYSLIKVVSLDDPIAHYSMLLISWASSMLFIGLFIRALNKVQPGFSGTEKWAMMFVPFYNAFLFFQCRNHDRVQRTRSIGLGVFILLAQINHFFPWMLFNTPYDLSHPGLPETNYLQDLLWQLLDAGFIIYWILFVFSIREHTDRSESPALPQQRLYLNDVVRGAGPTGLKWVVLIPLFFILTFLPDSKVDLFPFSFMMDNTHLMYGYGHDITTVDLLLLGWASIIRAVAFISLVVFIYHTYKTLYAMNAPRAISPGLAAGAWFIPLFQNYWQYAAFTRWRKPFENGLLQLNITSVAAPDKRITRLAAVCFLFYFLRPLNFLIWNAVLPKYFEWIRLPVWKYFAGTFDAIYVLFWSSGAVTYFMAISMTAFIVHVLELTQDLREAATKKLELMDEGPDLKAMLAQ
jgi:hypothetical protein